MRESWTVKEVDTMPDPLAADVVRLHAANRGEYGARKMKRALACEGKTASRRRIARIMKENGLSSAYSIRTFKPHAGKVNPSGAPNVVARDFSSRAPGRTSARTSRTCASADDGTTSASWSTCQTGRSSGIRAGRARMRSW